MTTCKETSEAQLTVEKSDDHQRGVCRIKPEFIIEDAVRTEDNKSNQNGTVPKEAEPATDEKSSSKKQKWNGKKDKPRGQNKQRPPPFRSPKNQNLCPWLVDQVENEPEKKCPLKNCQFLHDRIEYMKIKEPDIGDECYVFNLTGRCPRGAACRFGSKHLTEAGINVVDVEKNEEYKRKPLATKNQIANKLQDDLRKRKYDFSKVEKIMKEHDAVKKAKLEQNGSESADKSHKRRIDDQKDEIDDVKKAKIEEKTSETENDGEKTKNGVKRSREDCEVEKSEINGKLDEKAEKTEENSQNDEKLDDSAKDSIKKARLEVEDEVKDEKAEENGTESSEKRLGPVVDDDIIKLRPSEKKRIEWRDKILLSPLTTVGNLPFRRICKEYGADITCGEMALAPKILKAATEEWALVKRYETEDIFGVQICGNNTGVLARCAQLLNEQADIDFVDLNLGCPIELIYKQGGGSGMLTRRNVLESVVQSVSQVLDVPLTIKTRMGVYMDKPIAHNLTPLFRDWGASMITVHGRSREQRYTKMADWEYIERCAAAASPIPVYGNGDIFSYDDYLRARSNCPSLQGVTIGRGALIKPWIFQEIKEKRQIDMSSSERLEIVRKYANYGLDHWGSDCRGVETTRRFMLEWISFLHRYVPVGILESPPQRINERPPFYRGRDEMETLMASSNCADWVKISEMFLGKVPDGFHFLPKHKANSWK